VLDPDFATTGRLSIRFLEGTPRKETKRRLFLYYS
jgi:hypothetical protein